MGKKVELATKLGLRSYIILTGIMVVGICTSLGGFFLNTRFEMEKQKLIFDNQVEREFTTQQASIFRKSKTVDLILSLMLSQDRHALGPELKNRIAFLLREVGFECVGIAVLHEGQLLKKPLERLVKAGACTDTGLEQLAESSVASNRANLNGPLQAVSWTVSQQDRGEWTVRVIGPLDRTVEDQVVIVAEMPLVKMFLNDTKDVAFRIHGIENSPGSFIPSRADEGDGNAGEESLLKLRKKIRWMSMSIVIDFWAAADQLKPNLQLAWSVFIFGILLTAMVSWMARHLMQQNILINREVTLKTRELEEVNQLTLQANQVKSRFVGNLGHELRTPLSLILGMADLLAETPLNEQQREYVTSFKRAGNHLLDLIKDLLNIGRVEASETSIVASDVDVVACLEEICDEFYWACRKKQIQCFHQISPNIPKTLRIDPKVFRQIVINLLNNGIKFTASGYVHVTLDFEPKAEATGALVLAVIDTGIGISPESQSKIFLEFFQEEDSVSRSKGGVGLGLSIVDRLVNMWGGTISLKSQLGKGSEFTVRLPVERAAPEAWLEVTPGTPPLNILFVSDYLILARFIKMSLFSVGHQVESMDYRFFKSRSGVDFTHFDYVVFDLSSDASPSKERLADMDRMEIAPSKIVVVTATFDSKRNFAELEKRGITRVAYAPVRIRRLLSLFTEEVIAPVLAEDGVELLHPVTVPSGLRVLVAEDDEDNRFLIRSFLGNSGIDPVFSENGVEAFETIKSKAFAFDILITDLHMPRMDGFELIRNVRSWEMETKRAPIPILALTADAQPEQVEKVLKLGGNGYLTKPINRAKLIETLRAWHRSPGKTEFKGFES